MHISYLSYIFKVFFFFIYNINLFFEERSFYTVGVYEEKIGLNEIKRIYFL